MKFHFILTLNLLACLFMPITTVSASEASDFTIHEVIPKTIFADSEHELVFDITIPSKNGAIDYIQNLTLRNATTNTNQNINIVQLWVDGSTPGFQGVEDDILYTQGDWDTSNNLWVFRNINLFIPNENLRIFFTITTSDEVTSDSQIQMSIPVFDDQNRNNHYDFGDKGVFTKSYNHGPIDSPLTNPHALLITSQNEDPTPPEININNLKNNQEIILEELTACNFTGNVTEQIGSNVSTVNISINKENNTNWIPYYKDDKNNLHKQTHEILIPCPLDTGNYKLKIITSNETNQDNQNIQEINFSINTSYNKYANGWFKIIDIPDDIFVNIYNPIIIEIREPDFYSYNPNKTITKSSDRPEVDTFKFTENTINQNNQIVINLKPQKTGFLNLTLTDNGTDFAIITLNTKGVLEPGTLFKITDSSTIYYYSSNGKRYTFPNESIYLSWYNNFDSIITITSNQIAEIPFGGIVTYQPRQQLIKIQTDPKVYAVDSNSTLRWIKTEEIAIQLYGENWNKKIFDVADSFFINYQMGDPISQSNQFNLNTPNNLEDSLFPRR